MDKLSKNFGTPKRTVESMVDEAACMCSCVCPYTCPCTDVTNYAALAGSVLQVFYMNNDSSGNIV
jgi:hypothetical protein